MGAAQTVTEQIDQIIEYFNKRRMDLPDGFFDRKAQFTINGATFESLLSATPNDPLVLMLARGPAGYRFTAKAVQHAVPDAKIERGEIVSESGALTTTLRLSGTLRGTSEPINAMVAVAMRLSASGSVEVIDATMDATELQKLRDARLQS